MTKQGGSEKDLMKNKKGLFYYLFLILAFVFVFALNCGHEIRPYYYPKKGRGI